MKYEILCFGDVPRSKIQLVSNCYDVWNEVYAPILKEAGETITPDYFYRAKMLSVIHDGFGKPVAFSLLNNMHSELNGVVDQSYFDPAPPEFRRKLLNERHQVLTIEWVTVHPDQRGKFTKIQPVDLIMGLTFLLARHSPYTSVMGFSRVDLKADRVAGKFGPQPHGDVERHNILCKVMFAHVRDLHDHPMSQIQKVIGDLWMAKENHSPFIHEAQVLHINQFKKAG